jgi:bifunctional NMN adenylyltransferase/nudix hydrolase
MYKRQYAGLQYAPTFITGDSVVICAGHVLLIKRRAEPGKGLWAMPGGYMMAEKDRSVRDTALRELREETKIKVPMPVLIGSIKRSQVFDAIDRSPRGRIVTHAFLIELELVDGKLPQVKGSDDAEKAKWVPLSRVFRWECFEDHYEIIQNMVGA